MNIPFWLITIIACIVILGIVVMGIIVYKKVMDKIKHIKNGGL